MFDPVQFMIRGGLKKWRFPIPILSVVEYPSLRVNMLPLTCLAQDGEKRLPPLPLGVTVFV